MSNVKALIEQAKQKGYKFPNDLHTTNHLITVKPALAEKVIPILCELEDKGWEPRVFEGNRTLAQQREKVRKGYSKTMKSKHLDGNAVDVADKKWGWNGPAANLGYQYWQDQGRAVLNTPGVQWGGDWGRGWARYEAYIRHEVSYFCDVAHIQLNTSDV